jgi:L-iditol 2-dehydrogenase
MLSNYIKCLRWISEDNIILDKRMIPVLKDKEVLLKVESCGICGSDLKIKKFGNKRVKSGQIIGHEISGQIIKVNNNSKFKVGDKVSLGADIPCQNCRNCKLGSPNFCEENLAIGHEIEGGFSQYMVLNNHTLNHGPIKKFNNIDYDIASLAEPLACCINGYEKVSFNSYESVLIMGSGPIGVMLAFLANNLGIKQIFMTDVSDDRLEILDNFSFITNYTNSSKIDIKSWIGDNTKQIGLDLIFTANNNINSHIDALNLLRSRTVINFFGGLPANSENIKLDTNILHYEESVLTGSHGSTPKQHSEALSLIEKNKIFFKKIISKTYSIDEYEKAYESATNSKFLKILIKPNL